MTQLQETSDRYDEWPPNTPIEQEAQDDMQQLTPLGEVFMVLLWLPFYSNLFFLATI